MKATAKTTSMTNVCAWLPTIVLAWSAAIAATGSHAQEDTPGNAGGDKAARCATRVSIALHGESADASLLQSDRPQSRVDEMLTDPRFFERFARFINSIMNPAPGATPAEDAVYHLAKHVLQNDLPWKEVFVGQFNVVATGNGTRATVSVRPDPNGLGYFRSRAWLVRYAGNEPEGIKIATAYRMMNNVLGLKLMASTNAPDADVSANGRKAMPCAGCHYEGWYALDKTAELLGRVRRRGDNVTFTPADGQPKEVLGGLMLRDDADFIKAMVDSEQFQVNVCRTVFQFLYAREENACEAKLFDRCVEAFKNSGRIQAAIKTVAEDPSFCQ